MASSSVLGVIPARYGSTRFPGKPLASLLGRPLISWVYHATKRALPNVVVATDDKRIEKAVKQFGGKAIMTPKSCKSGTDRMHFVSKKIKAGYYANIQGDEPLIKPQTIAKTVSLARKKKGIATAAAPLKKREIGDRHVVKVVLGMNDQALYFSRTNFKNGSVKSDLPKDVYKHLGLYVYPRKQLQQFVHFDQPYIETKESLEQLRAIYNDLPIFVAVTPFDSVGVDTPSDLKKTEKLLKEKQKR